MHHVGDGRSAGVGAGGRGVEGGGEEGRGGWEGGGHRCTSNIFC